MNKKKVISLLVLLTFLLSFLSQSVLCWHEGLKPTYDATLYGSPTWITSGVNFSSLTSDYAVIPYNESMNMTTGLTLLIWLETPQSSTFVSKGWAGYGNFPNYAFGTMGIWGQYEFFYGNQYGFSDLYDSPFNQYELVGVSVSFSNGTIPTQITWYQNLTNDNDTYWAWGSNGIEIPPTNTETFDIVRVYSSGYQFFNVTIYGIYLFNRTITTTEEAYIYNHPDEMPSNVTGLVFYQKYDEGSGSTVLGYSAYPDTYYLALKWGSAPFGYTTPITEGNYSYLETETANITVYPYENYTLNYYIINTNNYSTDNPLYLSMDNNKTVTVYMGEDMITVANVGYMLIIIFVVFAINVILYFKNPSAKIFIVITALTGMVVNFISLSSSIPFTPFIQLFLTLIELVMLIFSFRQF